MTTDSKSKKQASEAQVAEIRELMRSLISYDDAGKVTLVDKEVFEKHLPEGITPEIINKFNTYTGNFIAGTTLAFGDASLEAFTSNKALERAKLEVPMVGQHNSFDLVIQRERESHNPGTGEKIVHQGHITVSMNGGWSGSMFKNARNTVREMFSVELKK